MDKKSQVQIAYSKLTNKAQNNFTRFVKISFLICFVLFCFFFFVFGIIIIIIIIIILISRTVSYVIPP